MSSFPYQRVVVVGATGSGKSTLAQILAQRFNLKYVELDALYWQPGWQPVPIEVFRERVETATQAEAWIVAGNYRKVRDLTWSKAQAVIWPDYSIQKVLWQLTRRTLKRWWTRELLWETNYEPLWKQLKLWSNDSLYNWLFQSYWRMKREYPTTLAQPEYRHLDLIRLRTPEETEKWLERISGLTQVSQVI